MGEGLSASKTGERLPALGSMVSGIIQYLNRKGNSDPYRTLICRKIYSLKKQGGKNIALSLMSEYFMGLLPDETLYSFPKCSGSKSMDQEFPLSPSFLILSC